MDQLAAVALLDPVLLPFLNEADTSKSEQLLAELIRAHADPVINRIIKTRLRVSLHQDQGSNENQDALEIASNLRASVIAELRELQNGSAARAIVSFPDYVAIKTFSACADYLREKNPQRFRLKNLLRRHLKQDPRFDLWRGKDHRWYAGLSSWGKTTVDKDTLFIERLNSEQVAPGTAWPALRLSRTSSSAEQLLTEIFETSGRALEFNRVVAIAAEAWAIRDLPDESIENYDDDVSSALVDAAPRIDLALEQRLYLARLWNEVCQLPVLQRTALLLNLRDAQGGSVICFIPFLGIAAQAEIAGILAMPGERFDSVWNELPLEDSAIAELLKLSRQQVINLRKTARERLARRMKKLEESNNASDANGKKR
jgi:hypothetical protein